MKNHVVLFECNVCGFDSTEDSDFNGIYLGVEDDHSIDVIDVNDAFIHLCDKCYEGFKRHFLY